MIYGTAALLLALVILPFLAGALFCNEKNSGPVVIVSGYMAEWAVFFLIAVFCVLADISLNMLSAAYFLTSTVLAVSGLAKLIIKHQKNFFLIKDRLSKTEMIYLACFLGVVLFQLYKTLFYAYSDGDDSFYIATAQDIFATNKLYQSNAYMGIAISHADINYRYALSPFPAWISVLALVSKVPVTVLAFDIIPCIFIVISYFIYNEISKVLFDDNREKRYIFLLLISVFVMFSNVSTSTAETFMLTRARQGKEGLANMVLPFMFCLIASYIKEWNKEENNITFGFRDAAIIWAGCLSGALMSVFGNLLIGIMIAFWAAYVLIKGKNFKHAVVIALLAIPNCLIALLYMKLS